MNRSTARCRGALAALLLAGLGAAAGAVDLRGRVEEQKAYAAQPFPVNAVGVQLLDGAGRAVLRSAVTGVDGFWYLTGVGPGRYTLHVGRRNYPLNVAPAPPAQNVPPIRLER